MLLDSETRVGIGGSTPTSAPPRPAILKRREPANWWRRYACAIALLDSAAMIVGATVALWVRFGTLDATSTGPLSIPYLLLAVVAAPAWVLTASLGGAYDRRYYGWGTEEYRRVFDSAVRYFMLVALLGFLFKLDVARGFVAIAVPLATGLTLLGRYVLRRWLHRMRRHGRFTKRVLVVGSPSASREARVAAPRPGQRLAGDRLLHGGQDRRPRRRRRGDTGAR